MLATTIVCILTTAVGAQLTATSAIVSPSDAKVTEATTKPAAQQCPCAYLERGGFWNSKVAAKLGIMGKVYVEKRCSCTYEANCDLHWRDSEKSLSLTWLGSQGISDSQIQLQFCSPIYRPYTPTCSGAGIAFSLRQLGWWVDLHAVHCRCPDTKAADGSLTQQPASIQAFRYNYPLPIGERLSGQIVDFVCSKPTECSHIQEPCYQEELNAQSLRTGGRVLCLCPAGSYCPIYKTDSHLHRLMPESSTTVVESNSTLEEELANTEFQLLCQLDSA